MEQVAGEALTLDPYAYSITLSGTLSVEECGDGALAI